MPGFSFDRPRPGIRAVGSVAFAAWRLLFSRIEGTDPATRLTFVLRLLKWGNQFHLAASERVNFIPSVPLVLDQSPWIIEIEDLTTLFFPYLRNGDTGTVDYRGLRQFGMVKRLLESANCRGVVTHLQSTRNAIDRLFASATITGKTVHLPMGIHDTGQNPVKADNGVCTFLFTNSWHQYAASFFPRGGMDLLHAFARLKRKHGDRVHLILRTRLPDDLPTDAARRIAEAGVEVESRFLDDSAFDALFRRADVYVLPAARIHIISMLEALARGLCLLTTDGWGFSEYVRHGETALLAEGRYGKVSWTDAETGALREHYAPLTEVDPDFAANLYEQMSFAAEHPERRKEIAANGRRLFENAYTADRYRQRLDETLRTLLHGREHRPGP